MSSMTSQITCASIVYPIVCPGADQSTHLNSASLAFVRGIHRWPVNSPHKGPVMWKMSPFDDVIMVNSGVIDNSLDNSLDNSDVWNARCCFNMKRPSFEYKYSYCKDNGMPRSSYFYNRNSHAKKRRLPIETSHRTYRILIQIWFKWVYNVFTLMLRSFTGWLRCWWVDLHKIHK